MRRALRRPTTGALAIAVLALIGFGAWLGTRTPAVEPTEEPVRAAEHAVVAPAPEREPTVVVPTPTTPAPEAETALPTLPPPEVDDATEARRTARPTVPPPTEPTADEADPGSSLREEIALLDRALRASEAGDPVRARAALDEHRARFPSGTLSPERDRMLAELSAAHDESATPTTPP